MMFASRLRGSVFVLLCAVQSALATVAIDTGHTPRQGGATSASGYPEYNFNRRFAESLLDALGKVGQTTIDLHSFDPNLSLQDRPTRAGDAAFFLSIHHDSIQQRFLDQGRATDFAGFSVFVSRRNPRYEESLVCALAIGEAMHAAGELPSLYHAEPVTGENRPLLDRERGVHAFDELLVLRAARTPAVLLEVGVIVNPNEELKLASDAFRAKVAPAVAAAIVRCTQRSSR